VALIPHTLEVTTLGDLAEGTVVNVEVDVVAKYVQRLMPPILPAVAAWTRRGSAAATALGEDPLGPRPAPLPLPRGEPELRIVDVELSGVVQEGEP
ncbi:MAG TPA: hypothetical protein VII47_06480, partial [Actinomycetota bacterium]